MSKKDIFKSLDLVKAKISELGLGDIGKWREDSLGWGASTPYFQFGEPGKNTGVKNNIAFYVESRNQFNIDVIKIVLNINDKYSREDALNFFEATVSQFFDVLNIKYSNDIKESILNNVFYENENISVDNTEISDVESIKLVLSNN